MKAITVQVQIKRIDVPNPMPKIKAFLVSVAEAVAIFTHYMLLTLGILAAAGMIISLIFPNAAGNAIAWALYEAAQWARGLE